MSKAVLADVGRKLKAIKQPEQAARPRVTLPIRTPAEIATLTLETPMAYAPYVFANTVTQFTGYAKRGKTSFLLYVIGCIVYVLECLDQPTVGTGVVYLTEERLTTMRAGLARAGLLDAPRLHLVSRWDLPAAMTWPQIVEAAIATCEETDSKVLVIDTFPAWAGLRGDAENSSGDVMEALEPVQRGAKHDIAVVIVQHDRKGGGVVGESGRGSSAFAGAVDTILSLRRPEGNTNPNQRVLEAVSRFDGVPDALVIERASEDSFCHTPTGSRFEKNLYRPLGEPGAVEIRKTETAIIDALKVGALNVEGLKAALPDHKPPTINRALEDLRRNSKVTRTGKGRKGDPIPTHWGPRFLFKPRTLGYVMKRILRRPVMASATETLIPLRNGPAVPERVVLWMLEAEDRGLHFRVLEDGRLFVGPRECIGAPDDQFIRQHRDALLACVTYIEQQG